jgi:hypothetical protein
MHAKGNAGSEILRWTESGGNWSSELFASGWGESEGHFWHSWTGGIVYKDGAFHINFSSGLATQGAHGPFCGWDGWPPTERGVYIRVDATSAAWEILARGMRTNEDTWVGPWGNLWSNDNQGEWMPSSRHYRLKEGRHYGHWHGEEGDLSIATPPAAYITHDECGESPTGGWTMTKGIYAGQMIVTDHDYHGILRDNMEMMANDEVQGCVFDWGGSLVGNPMGDGHPSRIITAPPPNDDVIIIGTAGTDPESGWAGDEFGPNVGALVKFVPNGTITYEMLAIRNLGPTQFEIEFTQPVNVSQATNPSNYEVRIWTESPELAYGAGAQVQNQGIDVQSATIVDGSDNKKVLLTFNNGDLHTGNVQLRGGILTGVGATVYFNLGSGGAFNAFGSSNVTSASGDDLFDNTAYYTLNQFGPGQDPLIGGGGGCMEIQACNYDPLAESPCADCCLYLAGDGTCTCATLNGCTVGINLTGGKEVKGITLNPDAITIDLPGAHFVQVKNIQGETVYSKTGNNSRDYRLTHLESGIYFVSVKAGNQVFSGRITVLK